MLWNCREAGNKIFCRNFKEIIRTHRLDVVALFETKVLFSSMGLFFNNLGYTASTVVDPVGRVGGIWLIWNPTQVSVNVIVANQQVIQATIQRKDYEDWVLAAVYASPNLILRQALWEDLEDTTKSMSKPWLIAGDFNEIGGQHERRSFSQSTHQNRSRNFNESINKCGLMDLGCIGPKFTWTNNRKGMANTMERLDRALCNEDWRTMYPQGIIRNLPRTYSDHSPLIIYTEGFLYTSIKLSKVIRLCTFHTQDLQVGLSSRRVHFVWSFSALSQEEIEYANTKIENWLFGGA
ncbi:hypothetical protein LOK49_LG10G01813 [Camellia lanceoleosa]|uniref:Uncharacterized protein n=1 Tax=Camellia lanceoleosa TaxID=1840588 RepID=A0ACC0GBQ8_9ERIC|nr:hypothetical protein LOK49_LG10G01813 [Camellia lanceoleosa]